MTVVLSLVAALCYGVSDFAGGFGSRRLGATTMLLWSYPVGAVLMVALLPVFPGHLDLRVLLLGVGGGGVAGLVGVLVMFHLMTVAPINVISPITAVLAAIVPVFVGFGVGERPAALTWFGIALGLVAVVLVSRSTDSVHARITVTTIGLALVSGIGFGLYFVCLGRAGSDAGLWPLTVSRITSMLLMMPVAWRARGVAAVRGRDVPLVVATGALDSLANLFFLLATHHGLLSVAGVLTSLYPATTVLLAVTLLHERLNRTQRGGLVLAAGAIVLITI